MTSSTTRHHLYPCLVLFGMVFLYGTCWARTWRVPQDAPTIQAAIDAAVAGDDVLVSSGTYFEHDIDVGKALWIRSRDGAESTVIDGQELDSVFDVRSVASSCTIEGFTLQWGRQGGAGTGGGAIKSHTSTLTVRDCVIQDCYGAEAAGGVLGLYSLVTIEDCVFRRNEGGGGGAVVVSGQDETSLASLTVVRSRFLDNVASWGTGGAVLAGNSYVQIDNTTFAGNIETQYGGAALVLYFVEGEVGNCTFLRNRSLGGQGSAIRLSALTNVRVEQCIVAYNTGACFEVDDPSGLVVACSDLFGNSDGNSNPGIDGGGNFSADPLFCDLEGGDYSLDPDSPCLPGQHPDGVDCGLVGALGEGCGGSTPTLETTWGQIKALYR